MRRHARHLPWLFLCLTVCPLAAVAAPDPAEKKGIESPVYDEHADAARDVAAALERAKTDGQRVLLVYGGNWCSWCIKLDQFFKDEADVRRVLRAEYQVVKVNVGHGDKNQHVVAKYGPKISGYPYLTVLDADGKVITHHDTGSLEDGPRHDSKKVVGFLEEHKAAPKDAEVLLREHMARAKAEGKLLFLRFGAPWCGWCHRLDGFLARPEIAEALGPAFVLLKVDIDRMTNGKAVQQRYQRQSGGIPWFAFLGSDGKPVATSDGPNGNVGFPATPGEIDHFVSMLKGSKKMTPEALASIERALRDTPEAKDAAAREARQAGAAR